MSDITRGHTFVSGEVVEAQSLNELVSNAVIQPTLISQKVLKDPAAMSDRILIEDSGALKGITIQQIIDLVAPSIANSAVPVGAVTDFAGPNEPTNWMFCYGQQLDPEAYSDLFAVLGTTYGGNGTTTFALPDYRSCVLAGRSNMGGTDNGALGIQIGATTLGAYGGEERHILSVNELATHTHSAPNTPQGVVNFTSGGAGGLTGLVTVNVGASGGNQPHNNLQPTRIANKIIKVRVQ